MKSGSKGKQEQKTVSWLWRLLQYVRPYGRHLVLLAVSVLLAGGINLLAPWPMKILVDHVFSTGVKSALPAPLRFMDSLPLFGQVALLALSSFFLSVGASGIYMYGAYRETVLGQRLVIDLRDRLFSHLMRLSLSFHQDRELGDTIYRVADDPWCIHSLILKGALPLATSSIQLIGLTVLLFRIDWSLCVVALGVMPFLLLCVRGFGDRITEISTDAREKEAHLLQVLQEVFGVIRVVQLFTREPLEKKRFTQVVETTAEAQLAETRLSTWFGLSVDAVTQAGRAAVLLFGGWHVVQGRLSIGTLLVVMTYLSQVYDPITEISGTFGHIQAACVNAKRVFEILDEQPEIEEKDDALVLSPILGEIQFDQVTFGYGDADPILKDVSFTVKPGETIALVGASGAGKSTIASLIPRLYDVTGGAIRVDGVDLRDLTLASLREGVSVVPQEVSLFSGTIAENIRYGRPDATDDEVEHAAQMAQAHDFILRQPEGYRTELGEHGEGLSGGERQRIALARAFLKGSPILILDEPTAALDVDTEAGLMGALAGIARHRTTLIIAHRLGTARMADRIMVVDRGRIAECGRPQDLIRANGIYARLCRVSEGQAPGLLLDDVFSELQSA